MIYLKETTELAMKLFISCVSSSSVEVHRFWFSSSISMHSGDTGAVLYGVKRLELRATRLRMISIDLEEVGGLKPPSSP